MKKIALLGVILAGQVCAMDSTGKGRYLDNSMVPYGSYNSVPVSTNALVAMKDKFTAEYRELEKHALRYQAERNEALNALEPVQKELMIYKEKSEHLEGALRVIEMNSAEEIKNLRQKVFELTYELTAQGKVFEAEMQAKMRGVEAEKNAEMKVFHANYERRIEELEKKKYELEIALQEREMQFATDQKLKLNELIVSHIEKK